MTAFHWRHRGLLSVSLLVGSFLFGAIGCSGTEVTGGGDGGGGQGGGQGGGGQGGGQACVVGGCSSQLCIEPGSDGASTCEWKEEYACYQQHGVCERDAATAQCGWRQTQELQDCIAAANNPVMPDRTPASGPCVRNEPDACASDADCMTGGCGGEVCHGVGNNVASTCDCTAPQGVSCGCVNGTCMWWQ